MAIHNYKNHSKKIQCLKFFILSCAILLLITVVFRYFTQKTKGATLQRALTVHQSKMAQLQQARALQQEKLQLASLQLRNKSMVKLLETLPHNLPQSIYLTDLTLTPIETDDSENSRKQKGVHGQLKGHFIDTIALQQWLNHLNQSKTVHQLQINTIQNRGYFAPDIEENSTPNSFELSFKIGVPKE